MIRLTKGATSTIICTLAEKQTITDANFLFVFTSRMTNEQIKFVLVSAADVSTNKTRWNEFAIVTNTYFGNYQEGWYNYEVYEQESTTNTDPTGLTLVEAGEMFLTDGQEVTTEQFNNDVTFTMYDAG
jgi:hypothetical protein